MEGVDVVGGFKLVCQWKVCVCVRMECKCGKGGCRVKEKAEEQETERRSFMSFFRCACVCAHAGGNACYL